MRRLAAALALALSSRRPWSRPSPPRSRTPDTSALGRPIAEYGATLLPHQPRRDGSWSVLSVERSRPLNLLAEQDGHARTTWCLDELERRETRKTYHSRRTCPCPFAR